MTIPVQRRNRRIVQLAGLLKTRVSMSAPEISKWLQRRGMEAACPKTIQRDIAYMRDELDALVEYDPIKKGYVLYNKDWTFPHAALQGDELFAAMFGESLAKNVMPPPLSASIDSAMRVQLAAGDPAAIDPQLFNSVAIAISSKIAADAAEVFQTVTQAWRECRRLRVRYRSASSASARSREIEVHALFLADGAWYARVYCHLRNGFRSLALHRITAPELLDENFERSEKIVREIQSGQVFDYETVKDVTVLCDRDKSPVIREREWFPGQTIEEDPDDGSLKLTIPEAPRPVLVWWILSYAGHLTATAPREIVEEIHTAAEKMLKNHPATKKNQEKFQQGQEMSPTPAVE